MVAWAFKPHVARKHGTCLHEDAHGAQQHAAPPCSVTCKALPTQHQQAGSGSLALHGTAARTFVRYDSSGFAKVHLA